MSAPITPTKGPRESRISQLWDDAWKEMSKGGVFEPYIAIAESELSNFGALLPPGDAAALADFKAAQNLHLFQGRHFAAHVGSIEGFRNQLQESVTWTYEQMTKFNEHAVRSLTLANGGVVLATLAYIQAKTSIPAGLLWVIGLCAAGYLLTVLGAHAVVALSSRPLILMSELRAPRVSEEVRSEKLKALSKCNKRMVWISRPIFYLSAACLAAALYIGVSALVSERDLNVMRGSAISAPSASTAVTRFPPHPAKRR